MTDKTYNMVVERTVEVLRDCQPEEARALLRGKRVVILVDLKIADVEKN